MENPSLADIESSIVEALYSLKDSFGIKVASFPDNPNEFGKPTQVAQILVGYKGERLSSPQTINIHAPIIQTRSISFEVGLFLKNLRSHAGAYPIMDKIRALLTGFQPSGCLQPLYCSTSNFVDLREGIWFYSMIFVTNVQSVVRSKVNA